MSNDLLGTDRYAQHQWWRASGWVEGGDDDGLTFAVERHGDRWLLTDGEGTLVAVGDGTRDLVASQGGLDYEQAPRGFLGNAGAALLRRFQPNPDWLASCEVFATDGEHAGRPANDLHLRDADYELVLGVDNETGIWTYLEMGDGDVTITIGLLVVDEPSASVVLHLLDDVPPLQVPTGREPVSEALRPVLEGVQAASGLQVEVVSQDGPETFRLALLDEDGSTVGLVSKSRVVHQIPPRYFTGNQKMVGNDEWFYHLDTSLPEDPRWAHFVLQEILDH